MNQLFTLFMANLKADKGRDINRTLILAGVVYCVLQLNQLQQEVAGIKARLASAHVASVEPDSGRRQPQTTAPPAQVTVLAKPAENASLP